MWLKNSTIKIDHGEASDTFISFNRYIHCYWENTSTTHMTSKLRLSPKLEQWSSWCECEGLKTDN